MERSPRAIRPARIDALRRVAIVAALLVSAACATMGPAPQKDDCRDRREAKPADWLNVDQAAKLVDEAPIKEEIARTGWLGWPKIAHAWVGVDHDGSVFCTRVDSDLSPRLDRAVRRALEAARYEPAMVLGGPHYSYLHVDVKLYTVSNEEACEHTEEDQCNNPAVVSE